MARAPEHADDLATFEQCQVQRHSRNLPGREADHEITPVPVHRAQRRLGVIVADGIVEHVRAIAAGQPLDVFATSPFC